MPVNVFPDGVVGEPMFFTNPPAPEQGHDVTGEDLSWVGGPRGIQPITSTNPDGDMHPVPLSVHS